jgi:translocation and assembly module TamB
MVIAGIAHKMNKVADFSKKILTVILWVIIGFVLLLIVAAMLIQIPAIQNKIVNQATSFVSGKTHTKVELEKISISFPKSVVIHGLYLEDTQQDTLVYAEKAKINIALYGLFSSRIAISSFVLENATINLYSTRTDSLFNYNFLLTAFSDKSSKKPDKEAVSKWTFELGSVALKNIRFTYNDQFAGLGVFAVVQKSEIIVDEINPKESIYSFDDILMEGLTLDVLTSESMSAEVDQPKKALPVISANKLEIKYSSVNYSNAVINLSLHSVIDFLELGDALIDISPSMIAAENLTLSNSKILYHSFASEMAETQTDMASDLPSTNNWTVTLNRIDAIENSFSYKIGDHPVLKNEFDAKNLVLNHLSFQARDFYYETDLTKASINNLSTILGNNFVIGHLETDFSMDEHSISTQKLKLRTPNADLDADFAIHYTTLETFVDSLEFTDLDLKMRNIDFKNSFILYFSPELISQPFFQNKETKTNITGSVTGPLNKLIGKNLIVKTGSNTVMNTDFNISGLPHAETALFDFPNLTIVSGKRDIELMAGPAIPENIHLPENISLQVAFTGQMKAFNTTIGMNSSYGQAQLVASIGKDETFTGNIELDSFSLGKLMNDTMIYGPVSLTAEVTGQGLDMETIEANILAEVSQIYLNEYNYQHLNLAGTVFGSEFSGTISLRDEYATFDFEGVVGLNPGQEYYQFRLDVHGADLQKLNITKDDIRIGFAMSANLEGRTIDELFGRVETTNLVVAKEEKIYVLDSLLFASINEPGRSEFDFSSALIDIKYSGNISPTAISGDINHFINNYFNFSGSNLQPTTGKSSDFRFEIQLRNHPIFSQVLFPQIKEFEPGLIVGSFNSKTSVLNLYATMNTIVYGTTEINDLVLEVNSTPAELTYTLSSSTVANAQISLDNFLLDGKLADDVILIGLSSTAEDQRKKLAIQSRITRENETYMVVLDPKEFYLMYDRWNIAADNFIAYGEEGLKIHNLFLNNKASEINITSVNDLFDDELSIEIKNFKLDDVSRIIEKDSTLAKGIVNGNILLKKLNDTYGIVADVEISDLIFREVPVGNLSIKADSPEAGKIDVDVNLSGTENNLTVKGFIMPNGGDDALRLHTTIQALSMKTIAAFSMGQLTEAAGLLSGDLNIKGAFDAPEITGELVFNDVFLNPAFLNNRLELKQETIHFKPDGIYFNSFTLRDANQHSATIDGSVKMTRFKDYIFALQINTKDFQLFNTTSRDNKEFFGRMVIDSRIDVKGPMALSVINATVKVKKGSNFTFAVPESRLTTDRGQGVVEFIAPIHLNPILYRDEKEAVSSTAFTGFDLSAIIEIDKEATLRLLMDPTSSDSLVVKGDAALSFAMDRSGKMTLTGSYNLDEGSYLVSLQSVIKKQFDILPGSTIIWNGDPLDAEISLNARYSVRAAPYDLVATQMSGMSNEETGGYKQRYPFWVMLKLKGALLHPVISFEIQLPPDEKGMLGGAVDQKLNLLNEDESALNKQVFALLVLGRFIQENPLQTETGGASAVVRSTVSNFLSAQLNQLTSKVIPGVELSFDIQSYDDYHSGQAEGRTEVEIGIKKHLFNERVSVMIGGSIDVEGEQAKQNAASDITSDVQIEYMLTDDGRYRLKGFRHNQYEGAIDGQLVETGVGVVFVRNFDKWRYFLRKKKTETKPSENE